MRQTPRHDDTTDDAGDDGNEDKDDDDEDVADDTDNLYRIAKSVSATDWASYSVS